MSIEIAHPKRFLKLHDIDEIVETRPKLIKVETKDIAKANKELLEDLNIMSKTKGHKKVFHIRLLKQTDILEAIMNDADKSRVYFFVKSDLKLGDMIGMYFNDEHQEMYNEDLPYEQFN